MTTNITPIKITLVGCGRMGGALCRGWLASGNYTITVIDPVKPDLPITNWFADVSEAPASSADVLIIAIKPQKFGEVLSQFTKLCKGSDTLILSVAAGKTISNIADIFGDAPIIRTMPNTPAAIGQGVTALIGNTSVSAEQQALATNIMEAAGQVVWLENEGQMDAVTGVSGSGPAYVFHFIEALAAAGENAGLSKELAYKLALGTVAGSGALAAADDSISATERREQVTSPNGTTAAGLDVLMQDLPALVNDTVAAAKARSIELSN